MENLTKEQKLKILSNAIDAGHDIRVDNFDASFEEGIKFLDDNELSLESTTIECSGQDYTWIKHRVKSFEIICYFNKV